MRILTLFLALLLFPTSGFASTPVMENYGLVIPKNWQEKATYLTIMKSEPLPSKFDWRDKLGKQVSILDQGNCGSCWAHSRVTSLAWQVLIQTGEQVDFSPQELVSCDKEQIGCSGGYWDDYEVKPGGISYEADFPYKASDLKCKANLPRKTKIDSWLYIGGKGRSPTKDEMKQAIVQYGPIGVTVSASGSFPSGCGNGPTNHMVVITGWDDAKGAWNMQNSWGRSFGTDGFAPVKYGCYRIGEASAIPLIALTPPKPVTFTMENDSVKLTVTVQPGSTYGVDGAKKALQNALNVVGLK